MLVNSQSWGVLVTVRTPMTGELVPLPTEWASALMSVWAKRQTDPPGEVAAVGRGFRSEQHAPCMGRIGR